MAAASRDDLGHLLRRTGFSARPDEIDALDGLSWEAAVDRVLDISGRPSPTSGAPALPAPGTNLSSAQWFDSYTKMVAFWLDRCATTPTPVVEKIALFLHGHLTTSLALAPHRLTFEQLQLYRSIGFSRYDETVRRASLMPAMLIYLDNRANVKGFPNENFARELMELFLVGVGKFSESDVREAARAWTGHTMDKASWTYRFRDDWHDHGAKTFMGVRKDWDGPEIIQHLVRGPGQRTCARFMAKRMWEFLAYERPSSALLDSLATSFIASDMKLLHLVRAIVLRPEFRSTTAKNGLLRSPIEYVVATMRHSGLRSSDVSPHWMLKGMGQEPFLPPNVDGWGTNSEWLSHSAGWAKSIFADAAAQAASDRGLFSDIASLSSETAGRRSMATFGVTASTTRTTDSLRRYVDRERSVGRSGRRGLIALTLMSPEFQLA